ncbi:MAG: hypothetical protein ABI192_16185 [Bradyrhizobium sp.]
MAAPAQVLVLVLVLVQVQAQVPVLAQDLPADPLLPLGVPERP